MELTENRAERRKRRLPWKWITLGLVLISLFVAVRVLPVTTWLNAFNEWVAGLGTLGLVLFILVYIIATILFVPGSVLTIGAGFTFGVLWGSVAVSVGATIGAALAFLIARYVARERIVEKVRGNEKLQQIDTAIGQRGAKLIFLLRLSPLVPFNLSNYFYGLTGVKFWPYVLASWLGMIPGTILYVYLGAAGKAGIRAAAGEETMKSTGEWVFLGVGLLATLIVTIVVTRIARNALRRSEVT